MLITFYDLKYLNLTKSQLSNQKSGIVLKVTLIQNSKINTVAKFQVGSEAIRIISSVGHKEHTLPFFKKEKILPIMDLCKQGM